MKAAENIAAILAQAVATAELTGVAHTQALWNYAYSTWACMGEDLDEDTPDPELPTLAEVEEAFEAAVQAALDAGVMTGEYLATQASDAEQQRGWEAMSTTGSAS